MHLEHLLAALEVRRIHTHLAVKAARTQQGRVEDVGTVGGRNHDDVGVDVKAIHLHQHLVKGLLAFVVTTTHAGAAVAAHGIDLVNKDDGRAVLLGLLKEVAHAAGANAHEHLHKIRAANAEERHPCLACNGARKKSLSRSRRAVQQNALRDLGAYRLELGWAGEELLNLAKLLDCLVNTCDIVKLHLGGIGCYLRGARAAKLHDPAAATLHGREEEPQQPNNQDDGQKAEQNGRPQ